MASRMAEGVGQTARLVARRNQDAAVLAERAVGGRASPRRLQKGELLGLPHARPMPSIGKRCHELGIQDEEHAWRIVYRIDSDAIVIVAVFGKKTRKTPREIIATSRRRLKAYDDVVRERREP